MSRWRLLFWRRLDWSDPPRRAVRLSWVGAMTRSVGYRIGVWQPERWWTDYAGERSNHGPGFVCYWTGTPLCDRFTHWAKP